MPVVREHGGHANKFLGDGVLAVFGAPERLPDHADARRGLRAGASSMRSTSASAARSEVGVGLNSGPVVVGSVGGGGRLEFTVIGDPVNVAARVESITRETGDAVLLTEATRRLLDQTPRAGVEARGEAELRGIAEPVPLYALDTELGRTSDPPPDNANHGRVICRHK